MSGPVHGQEKLTLLDSVASTTSENGRSQCLFVCTFPVLLCVTIRASAPNLLSAKFASDIKQVGYDG